MKLAIVLAAVMFSSAAYAETCEESIWNHSAYVIQREANEILLPKEALQQAEENLRLEVEAVCDVILERGKKSKYWEEPVFTWDEIEFASKYLGL